MSARVSWTGMAELLQELRRLPSTLTDEAAEIVTATAHDAAREIRGEYPVHTGELQKGVRVTALPRSAFGVTMEVRNTANLAFIYEHGTEARHTAIGADRGSMPANPIFGRVMGRRRRAMYLELARMMRRNGLEVRNYAA